MSWQDSYKVDINNAAVALDIPYEWLFNLINFESAGSFDPFKQNPTPGSTARGLIQIIDKTAKSMFQTDSLTLANMYPDFTSNMENVVYPYLSAMAPFPTKQSLYMSIFYPAYRNKPPTTEFPADVQRWNPGIKTVQDYIDKVDKAAIMSKIASTAKTALPLLIIAGVAVFLLFRGKIL